MKKIVLNESERERILSQYNNSLNIETKKFKKLLEAKLGTVKPLLGEQVELGMDYEESEVENEPEETNPNIGYWTKEAEYEYQKLMNSLTLGGYNPFNRTTFATKMTKFCTTDFIKKFPEGTSMEPNEIKNIVENIGNAMKKGSREAKGLFGVLPDIRHLVTAGRGVSDEAANTFKQELLKLNNVANFCFALTMKPKARPSENIIQIFDEIYKDNVYQEKIKAPMETTLMDNMQTI
jgi:hypothetical protein